MSEFDREAKESSDALDAAMFKIMTAPRVTPDDIEVNIASEHYFTALEGALSQSAEAVNVWHDDNDFGSEKVPLGLLTFCVLVLKNGFTVAGESACASPENFDAEIGRKIARQNAVEKCWPLLGYALKEQLAQQAVIDHAVANELPPPTSGAMPDKPVSLLPHQQRVVIEKADLDEKLEKLTAFIDSDNFRSLSFQAAEHLHEQASAMRIYSHVLGQRIAAF